VGIVQDTVQGIIIENILCGAYAVKMQCFSRRQMSKSQFYCHGT